MYERNIARVEISPELLVKHLHMPDGTDIVGATVERGVHGPVVALLVEHPDLPLVGEGIIAETISPIITYHKESWDFDWNVPAEHALQMDDQEAPDAEPR